MDWSSCFFPQTDSISRCASATWKCCLHRFGEVPTGQHKPKVHGKKLIKYISNCLKLSNPMSTKHPKHPKVHQLSINCLSFPSIFCPWEAPPAAAMDSPAAASYTVPNAPRSPAARSARTGDGGPRPPGASMGFLGILEIQKYLKPMGFQKKTHPKRQL